MLVRLPLTKGGEIWVNPLQVRVVRPKGDDRCEVVIDVYTTLKVALPPQEAVDALDAATPPVAFVPDTVAGPGGGSAATSVATGVATGII